MGQDFFAAFISYSSHDAAFAIRLQLWLEAFEIPPRLLAENPGSAASPGLPSLRPVFRDQSELAASGDVWHSLRQELDVSRSLIVICSEHSVRSTYVDREVRHFRSVKPQGPILGILPPGTAYQALDLASFVPKALLDEAARNRAPLIVNAEADGGQTASLDEAAQDRVPLIANAEADGEQTAFLRLAAGLLHVRYSVLSDRHAEREAQIRRQRSRLAAKTHTLPAEKAYLAGDVDLAIKHALSAIIEGDDPTWSEAPELEATVAEYVVRKRDSVRFSAEAGDGKRALIHNAFVASGRLLIAGSKDGRVLMADAQTGETLVAFNGDTLQEVFKSSHSAPISWDPARPIRRVAESPSGDYVILTHARAASSWRVSDCTPTGLYTREDPDNLFAFASTRPFAALAYDAEHLMTTFAVINYETGAFVRSELRDWEPLAITFSAGPWGEDLVIASRTGTLYSIDPATARTVNEVTLRENRIRGAAFAGQGRALRIGSFYSAETGVQHEYLERGDDGQWRAALDPLLSGINPPGNYTIGVHSPDESRAYVFGGEPERRLLVSRSRPPFELDPLGRQAAFSPDGSKFLLESEPDALYFLDAVSGEQISRLQQPGTIRRIPLSVAHAPGPSRGAWSNDSGFVALSCFRRPQSTSLEELMRDLQGGLLHKQSVEIRNAANGRLVSAIPSLGDQIDFVGFTPDSSAAWVLYNNLELRLVGLAEPRLLWALPGHRGVGEMAVNPQGTTVAVVEDGGVGDRKAILAMDAGSGEAGPGFEPDTAACRLHFRNAGELIVACRDGTVRLFDLERAAETHRFRDHAGNRLGQAFLNLMEVSRDGEVIVTATREDRKAPIVARDLRSGEPYRIMKTDPAELRCLAITPDGGKIAYSNAEGDSFVIDRRTGSVLAKSELAVFVRALQIAIDEPRNRFLVLGAFGHLHIFNLQTGGAESADTIVLRNQDYGLETGIILPEHDLVVVAEEQRVQIVAISSKKTTLLESADGIAVPPIAVSPDGSLVATSSQDASIRLWRTSDGRRVSTLRQAGSPISLLRFSPDGRRLFSADEEGFVCAWDVADAYLRGVALTQWIRSRIGDGILVLNEIDDRNLLLRDVLTGGESASRDLVRALDKFAPQP